MLEIAVVFDVLTQMVVYVPVVFRASGIALLFMAGWALNVRGFEAFNIPFRKVLNLRKTDSNADNIMEATKLLACALVFCYMLHELCGAYEYETGQSISLVAFWLILVGLVAFSKHSLFRELRQFMRARCVAFFHGEVLFVDVLAADVLCSMSKLLADMQVVVCAVFAVFTAYPDATSAACVQSTIGPILASLPFGIRAVQCLVVYNSTGVYTHLLNFGKYMSSFPVIWISALQHQSAPAEGVVPDAHDLYLQELWLYSVTLNTLYSFVWDVLMDWGLAMGGSRMPLLRDELL